MKEPVRKIAFLVDKNELDLLNETCLYGADADKNLEKAIKEGDQFRLEFLFDELDDLAGQWEAPGSWKLAKEGSKNKNFRK